MKKIIAAPLVLISILIFSGCSLYGNNQAPAAVPSNANEIVIQKFTFNPATLTVAKGTTITWVNNDSASHQIKADIFNSEVLGKSQKFSFTFSDSGTFEYICGIHPSMKGKIIVE